MHEFFDWICLFIVMPKNVLAMSVVLPDLVLLRLLKARTRK
jgi:hypothetical protein